MIDICEKLLRPYLLLHGNNLSSSDICYRAKRQGIAQLEHAITQLNELAERLKMPYLDSKLPNWLDEDFPEVALSRILSMLDHLMKIERNSSSPFNVHTVISKPGENAVSTPLMLATYALLLSHTRWTSRFQHDFMSAQKAEKLISGCQRHNDSFPKWIVKIITGLIVFKNIFRTSVGTNSEVAVWDNGGLSLDQKDIVAVMSHVIQTCFSSFKGDAYLGVLNSLAIVAATYEARFGNSNDRAFSDFAKELKNVSQNNVSIDGKKLLVLEFGRYILPPLGKEMNTKMEEILKTNSSNKTILWFSLDRYWATQDTGGGLYDMLCKENCFEKMNDVTWPDPFSGTSLEGQAQFFNLKLFAKDACKLGLGFIPIDSDDPWQIIKQAIHEFREQRREARSKEQQASDLIRDFHRSDIPNAEFGRHIPWAYIMRVLRVLAHIYGNKFFELHIKRPDSPALLGDSNTIWLPKDVPDLDNLEISANNHLWDDPKLVVARCFASLLSNQLMAFGIPTQELSADEPELVEDWLKVNEWVSKKNNHRALTSYLDIALARRAQSQLQKWQRLGSTDIGNRIILGIDIGGTNVKVTRFQNLPSGKKLDRESCSFRTQPSDGRQYYNTHEFVKRLDSKLLKEWGTEWEEQRKQLVAIGVTWPGAVGGPLGLEYVSSYSSSLRYFQPFHERFWEASIEEIHSLRLREAFVEYFALDNITVKNDGVAHVIHEQGLFSPGMSLNPGETVIGFAAGTSTAMAVLAANKGDEGRPLAVLAEAGRCISDIGCPFTKAQFPVGSARPLFNKETLSRIARGVLLEWGIKTDCLPEKPEFFISDLFTKRLQDDQAEENKCFDSNFNTHLQKFNKELVNVGQNKEKFVELVAQRMGQNLADLIAMAVELFGSKNVFAGGGPMSGAAGFYVREKARQELRKTYGFDVPDEDDDNFPHHLARRLRFPEPKKGQDPEEQAAAYGAAIAATWILQENDIAKVGDTGGNASLVVSGRKDTKEETPSFSVFSVLELGIDVPGRILFPGRFYLPEKGTVGYVRSKKRAKKSERVSDYEIPKRDYDAKVLTPVGSLLGKGPYSHDHIIISLRNTLNEYGYSVRLQETWWKRKNDGDLSETWPVIVVTEKKTNLCPLGEVKNPEADLVTGIPLVIDGTSQKRSFFLANCSDIAHTYEVDPKGRLGPPGQSEEERQLVWRELSEKWQVLKDTPDEDFAHKLNQLAEKYGAQKSCNLLHSVIAQRYDGSLVAFAITASLDAIADELASSWKIKHAILLDNGGSVGWLSFLKGKSEGTLLVAGPNYRPRGMAFLDLRPTGFVHPHHHPCLKCGKS